MHRRRAPLRAACGILWYDRDTYLQGKADMHTIPILLGGLLTLLLGLIAWSVWTGVRAELEESAVGWHQDVLLGLLLFAMFGLGVFVAFLVLDLVK